MSQPTMAMTGDRSNSWKMSHHQRGVLSPTAAPMPTTLPSIVTGHSVDAAGAARASSGRQERSIATVTRVGRPA
jgi:hypothetical protein